MKALTIVDTGPLVALLDSGDAWHSWALSIFRTLPAPLLTCEAVFAETWYLLRASPLSQRALLRLHRAEVLRLALDVQADADPIWRLLEKYQDTPMDFADACLVRMAEHFGKSTVWTLDGDFRIYRKNGRHAIPLLHPK